MRKTVEIEEKKKNNCVGAMEGPMMIKSKRYSKTKIQAKISKKN